jgi:hypothetical protein
LDPCKAQCGWSSGDGATEIAGVSEEACPLPFCTLGRQVLQHLTRLAVEAHTATACQTPFNTGSANNLMHRQDTPPLCRSHDVPFTTSLKALAVAFAGLWKEKKINQSSRLAHSLNGSTPRPIPIPSTSKDAAEPGAIHAHPSYTIPTTIDVPGRMWLHGMLRVELYLQKTKCLKER